MKNTELTANDLKWGLMIEQKAHPEFGRWRVGTDAGYWTVTNSRGTKVLDTGELNFWKLSA